MNSGIRQQYMNAGNRHITVCNSVLYRHCVCVWPQQYSSNVKDVSVRGASDG